jgi:hypothetical protein
MMRALLSASELMTPLHPPKPRLVVRVGITGHRPNKLHGAAAQRIEKQLPLLFAAIETAARDILSANSSWYSTEPPAVRLVSGFAQGADQMAVAVCPGAWQVEAVLPFPMDEYLEDFEDSGPDGKRSPRDTFKELLKRASAVTQLPFAPSESGESERVRGDSGNRAKGYDECGQISASADRPPRCRVGRQDAENRGHGCACQAGL